MILTFVLCSCRPIKKNWTALIERVPTVGFADNSSAYPLLFISPDTGFVGSSIVRQRKFFSSILKTENGGYSWTPTATWLGTCVGLQYYQNTLYGVFNNQTDPPSSVIRKSDDLGTTWEDAFSFDGGTRSFHVFNYQTISYIKSSPNSPDCLMLSKDGGNHWHSISLPGKISIADAVYTDGALHLLLIDSNGETLFYSLEVYTGKSTIQPMPSVSFMTGSQDIVATNLNGVRFYTLHNGTLSFLSRIRWGGLFSGSYNPRYISKSQNIVFCLCSQYPGKPGEVQALLFSDDGGRHWEIVEKFAHGLNRGAFAPEPICSYEDDNSFRLYYIVQNGDEKVMNTIKVDKPFT